MSGMDRLTEMLPCPFCGGTEADGTIERAHGTKYVMHNEGDDCAAFRGVLIPTQHWNRRASQAAPAPSDGLREAAEHALDTVQKFISGQSVTADEKALADRVAMAACFAAEAYNHACMEEDGIYGLQQSFLRALVDPLHPGLDYLRDDPSTGPAARAALNPAPAQEGGE